MQALDFWKMVTMDRVDMLENLVSLFRENQIEFCVIGGQGVNAYVEPLVSLDLDIVVAAVQLEHVERILGSRFELKRFSHSLNVTAPGSAVRVQIQTDRRYQSFIEGAVQREVLGMILPVAAVEDVMQGKVWAAADSERRGSKRQKDLADIARLLEKYPHLSSMVPKGIRDRLEQDHPQDQ